MKGKERKGLSIKIVAALYSIIAITVLTVVIVLIGYHLFRINVTENYEKYTLTVLENAYTIASDFSFGDMIADRSMPHKYEELRERLNKIKETSDIQYLYAIYFDDIEDSGSLMYAINTKTTEELAHGGTYTYLGTACEEGSFQPETIDTLWNAVKNGQQESGILQGYSEGYGYMLNGYKVIFDSDGNAVGLLCVEIDITNIHVVLNRYVRNVIIFAALFMIVLTVFYVGKIEHSLIFPITGITDAANEFIRNIGDQKAMDESAKKLEQLDIDSDNEVGDLYRSVSKMETDMANQLRDIRQYADNILKMKNGLMILMADMVEVRDSNTGDHIQKTASYVRIILEGLRKKGYYGDILTPQYIEDVVRSAPLHDIGKIKIPDAILNKPGKLTDEEYEIMKTHAAMGREIIDKAISSVEGEGYLNEARNMVASHHERWDGKGYPEGLHDDQIPLSARVMAVADVFDALTSARVYKPAFPLSEAVKIIKDGSGTQFDPKCVEVLLDEMPRVKEILKKLNPEFVDE
ncbi:MAG: HD domain-containing protein [Clostridiales bacterium]|nr:HD domain-containing protein [Clostridiales bacterium]